jgi:hypothetical protein
MPVSISEFELRKKLQEAFRSGRYFITITTVSEDGKKLDHHLSYQNFPSDDLMPTLSHLASKIDENAETYS